MGAHPYMDTVTGSIVPAGATSGSPVSWQTVYFLLVPLAISTATQPSGRIGCLSIRYRTYLRISPLVCFLDIWTTFLYIIGSRIFHGKSFTITLDDACAVRFDEEKCDGSASSPETQVQEHSGSLQGMKKETFFRWIFFVFGGLLPGIKFMALYGVMWSKVWGIMYLTSFVAVEILVIFSKRSLRRRETRASGSSPVFPSLSGEVSSFRDNGDNVSNASHVAPAEEGVNHCDQRIILVPTTGLAIASQVIFLFWATVSLFDRIIFGFNDPDPSNETYGDKTALHWHPSTRHNYVSIKMFFSFAFFSAALLVVFTAVGIAYYLWTVHFKHRSKIWQVVGSAVIGVACFLLSPWSNVWFIGVEKLDHMWYPLLLLPFPVIVCGLYFAILMTGRRWPRFLTYLALDAPSSVNTGRNVDRNAILAFIFFLLHIFVPLFWYAFVYNPRWTHSPSWLAVFG